MRRQKAEGGRQNGSPGVLGGAGRTSFPLRRLAFRAGYTLTEIMIVISIIVLLLALAVPALKFITGGKSVEAAENQLAAILSRARAEAISKQKVAGILFYFDPGDSRTKAALVEQADGAVTVTGWTVNQPDVILELATDDGNAVAGNPVSDPFVLPPGMAVQLIDNCYVDTSVQPPRRWDDGYMGFNSRNQYQPASQRTYDPTGGTPRLGVKYGGVLLFDTAGRLVARSYAFHTADMTLPTPRYTLLGRLLFGKKEFDNPVANDSFVSPTPETLLRESQFGLVVFDREAFTGAGYGDEDAQVESTTATQAGVKSTYQNTGVLKFGPVTMNPEEPEEKWLDENATPLILNRYTGAILRAE